MGFKTSCLVALLILVHASAEASSVEMAEEEKIRTLLPRVLTGKTTLMDRILILKESHHVDIEISPSPERSSSYLPSQNPVPSPIGSFFRPKPTGRALSGDLSEKNGKSYKPVVIAVAVTAPVTFAVVGLLFLCCNMCCEGGRNDSRALLSLNKTDFSAGASPDIFAYGSPAKDGKLELESNIPMHVHRSCSIESNFCTSVRDFDLNDASGCEPPPPQPPDLPPRPPASPSPPQPPAPPPVPPEPTGNASPRTPPPPPPKSGGGSSRPPQPISLGSNAARPSKPPSNTPENDSDAPKPRLKPFFWDKVLANPGHSMVWHQIKSGSFQFNEEMIQTLFGYAPADKNKNKPKKESLSSNDPSAHQIQIIDSKKAQNLSILLRASNVTEEEICNAVAEGNELNAELVHNLLKMAPTAEEELKLRLYDGKVSQLGPADRFLKALVDIPFTFKKLEALHFMGTLQEDLTAIKGSFTSLKVACKELKNSRLFIKLLEAVLKTGNRMNDGTFRGGAQAFKLDTLLRLSDVKGSDGKTTLLLFVIQELIRSEGIRAARARTKLNDSIDEDEASLNTEDHYKCLGLEVISSLGNELENVKRAAAIDFDSLRGSVAGLSRNLVKTREFLDADMKNTGQNSGFYRTLKSFLQNAEVDVETIVEEEERITDLVNQTGDYFHGKARDVEGLQLFLIVRDFLIMVDKACKQARQTPVKTNKKDNFA